MVQYSVRIRSLLSVQTPLFLAEPSSIVTEKDINLCWCIAFNVSYNLPKFCPNATWDPNAITLADVSLVGTNPHGIFVDTKNTVYVAARDIMRIQVWVGGSISANRSFNDSSVNARSLFVTSADDIYFDNGEDNGRIDKWAMSSKSIGKVMTVATSCRGLFIDLNSTLYCSTDNANFVKKMSLIDGMNVSSTAAGDGTSGSAMSQLKDPEGIFVDFDFNLYVADRGNNRIQRFMCDNTSGTTIPTGSIVLNQPTGVVLDIDDYLFIVDMSNNRIIGSGPNGFRCVAGCSGIAGGSAVQLKNPITLSFDSIGNMFVVDKDNNRVQKFLVLTNSCSKQLYCPSISWMMISILNITTFLLENSEYPTLYVELDKSLIKN